jgi:hypothetical protein
MVLPAQYLYDIHEGLQAVRLGVTPVLVSKDSRIKQKRTQAKVRSPGIARIQRRRSLVLEGDVNVVGRVVISVTCHRIICDQRLRQLPIALSFASIYREVILHT